MTSTTAFVRIQPQCAFPSGPWVSGNLPWTDLTNYMRDDTQFKITRGRSNEFSQFEPGKLSGLVLDNRTRVFDPNYSAAPAPFAGNVYPSKQFRVLAEYPWLPGMLPDGNARNVGWSTLSGTGPTTYDQAGFTYDQGVYDAPGPNVTLTLVTGDAPEGISLQQALAVKVTAGTVGAIQYTLPANSVTPGKTVTLAAKVKLTSAFAGAVNIPQLAGINFFDVNGNSTGSISRTAVASKRVWGDGTGFDTVYVTGVVPANTVTVQLELQAQVQQANDTVYFDAVVFDYCSQYIAKTIAYTYVDDWKLTYKARDALCTVEASDAMAAFSVKDLVSLNYEAAVLALPNLAHYWTLGERADWNQAYTNEYGPGSNQMPTVGFIGWGVPGPVLTDLTTGAGLTDDQTMKIGGWFDIRNFLNPVINQGWTLGFWVQQSAHTDRVFNFGLLTDPNSYGVTGSSSKSDFINIYTNGGSGGGTKEMELVWLHYPTSASSGNWIAANFAPPPDVVDPRVPAYTTPGDFYDGAWHFVCITLQPDNVSCNIMVDGQMITPRMDTAPSGTLSGQTITATGTMGFPALALALMGGSQGIPGFTGQLAHVFSVNRAITTSEHANLYNIAQNQWFGQSPQSRVNAVLDTGSFPSSMRKLDVGSSTLAAETASLAQTNMLQYLQYVQDSESGWIFVDMAGFVNLIGRVSMVKKQGTTPTWILGDLWPQNLAQELPMVDSPELDNGNTLIYTEAEGSMGSGASGGSGSSKTSGTLYYYADNQTLINQGKRTISKSNMLNTTESEVLSTLQYLVANYKTPRQRLQRIKVMPVGTDELWQFVLGVEVGQVVQVNFRPPPAGSNMTSLVGRVQHVDHTIGRRRWETEIQVATVDVNTYVNLDDPVLGKLDSGNKLFF